MKKLLHGLSGGSVAFAYQLRAFGKLDFEVQAIHEVYTFDDNAFFDSGHKDYELTFSVDGRFEVVATSFYEALQDVATEIGNFDVGCDASKLPVCFFNGDFTVQVGYDSSSAFSVDSTNEGFLCLCADGVESEGSKKRNEESNNGFHGEGTEKFDFGAVSAVCRIFLLIVNCLFVYYNGKDTAKVCFAPNFFASFFGILF